MIPYMYMKPGQIVYTKHGHVFWAWNVKPVLSCVKSSGFTHKSGCIEVCVFNHSNILS